MARGDGLISPASPGRFGKPFDYGRSNGSTQRISFGIGKSQAPNECSPLDGKIDGRGSDRIKPQLRPAEQSNTVRLIDRYPGKIDEAGAGRTLDVRTLEIDAG